MQKVYEINKISKENINFNRVDFKRGWILIIYPFKGIQLPFILIKVIYKLILPPSDVSYSFRIIVYSVRKFFICRKAEY